MAAGPPADPSAFDVTLEIAADADAVFAAFFAPELLRTWWSVSEAVTTPRPLGIYALAWPTYGHDDLIGPLGGTFYGVVIDVRSGREFFHADAYLLPPVGDPIGPMALHVACEPVEGGTRLRIQQSGCDDSPRWRRFYRVIDSGWTAALQGLQRHLEETP